MKGYKAFKKGLICKGKQYAENTVFEEDKAVICKSGMHFCENPLDTLDYYPLIDENGDLTEFAEVEALDEVLTDDNKKYCTKKLKVGAKLSLEGFIKASFDVMYERTKKEVEKETEDVYAASGKYSKLAASGDASKLAASGDESKLAASGDASKLAASGDVSNLAASGKYSNLAASGDASKLAASGDASKLAASGDVSNLAASGKYSKLAASGDASKLAASGDVSNLAASGDVSNLAASGYASKLAASGDASNLAASGYASNLAASGKYSKLAASGDESIIESTGAHSVICCAGHGSIAKGKIGSWITLAEWKYSQEECANIPVCVKTERIDGERIKEDTFYKLKNGEFIEVENG